MRFDIITIFPEILSSYINESLFWRAREKKIIKINFHDLRRFSTNRHHKVDDKPFGGGPGMVMQVEPIYKAISKIKNKKSKLRTRVILFSTRGKVFDAASARRLAKYDQLIFICGRYEGVDERVAQYVADEELSLGNFVLSGGELPAMMVSEAVARHVPGFLGDAESLEEVHGSAPSYTRPAEFKPKGSKKVWKVPDELLSGNHAQIKQWRALWSRAR